MEISKWPILDETMTVPLHGLIQQRREQLGISKEELASRIGLPESMYRDVEFYADELTMVLPLKNVRSLAAILDFELSTLLGADSQEDYPSASRMPRRLVLAEARERLDISAKKMANDIGFDEAFIHKIESDSEALENYPYEVVKIVARYLKLAPRDLIRDTSRYFAATATTIQNICPVCGVGLDFAPWHGSSPADEICPCCGIQFGYHDAAGGGESKREEIYAHWRQRWIDGGMQWSSRARKPPKDWNPSTQLARLKSRK